MSDEKDTESFAKLDDERFGRIVAYQVKSQWPFPDDRRRLAGSGKGGRRLELLESVSDIYLDASEDTTGDQIEPDSFLPLVDCDTDSTKYLTSVPPEERDRLMS